MRCSVVYATHARQWCLELQLPAASTVAQALEAAQRPLSAQLIRDGVESPRWELLDCGIFGQPCSREQPLQPGDRLELYRPLQADPRERRRSRVQAGRRRAGQ